MKISKTKLRQIIKEELGSLNENDQQRIVNTKWEVFMVGRIKHYMESDPDMDMGAIIKQLEKDFRTNIPAARNKAGVEGPGPGPASDEERARDAGPMAYYQGKGPGSYTGD